MKEDRLLVVVRHGTARMPAPGEEDVARTLTPEGERGVELVAQWLAERVMPCRVFTSPARRALQTAAILCGRLLGTQGQATEDPNIYEASRASLLRIVGGFDHPHAVVLVGHNPGLEELASFLLDRDVSDSVRLVPGHALCLRLPTGWAGASRGVASLEAQVTPGQLLCAQ